MSESAAFGWPRIRFALIFSIAIGLFLAIGWKSGVISIVIRAVAVGLIATVVFGVFERWPRRLPRWLARWVLQVAGVGAVIPFTTFVIWMRSTMPNAPPFWKDPDRLEGFWTLTIVGILFAPWIALAALVRQKDALARNQALAFDLQRSELERQALDARLHLLQAQVAPHFLFNTLANIQALVDAGSPQASNVLRSLIAYLRAAVPLLNEPVATIDQELQLAQAYLELMHMRIPDRLQFELHVDPAARSLRCPPTAILTLVENAVRHGIDPSEEGGRIDIHVQLHERRCRIRVIDTGVGFRQASQGLGTGLSTLRERLQLMFGNNASMRVIASETGGVCAELEIPA
jgi:signal transduction histidine kinase